MFSRQQLSARQASAQNVLLRVIPFALCCFCYRSNAADLDSAKEAFAAGQYREVAKMAESALKEREDVEDWGVLMTQALMALGRYSEALQTATNALAGEPRSVRLRWAARKAYLFNDQPEAAARMTGEIERQLQSRSWLYRDPESLVLFGRIALLAGTDPRTVLEKVYDRIKKANPKFEEVYVASGELALEKHDHALAAKLFQEGLKALPTSAELHYGLARAYAPSDQKLMIAELEAALNSNSNHVPSLLLLADHEVDAEDYAGAERFLDNVKEVNPDDPEAWAYRAVIHHLRNQPEEETKARDLALSHWRSNPRVDFLIGTKLSQKYRFALGASHQKRALAMDGDYLPSKIQLAQDLLRLGEESDGWRLAQEVQQQDAYDVQANNLTSLHDVISKFQTLTNGHFHLRLNSREAALYGQRALDLLERARTQLCKKYGIELPDPVLVEMFNDEKDFAVRTFGMPENDGFLGVCFGQVITANGPAARRGHHFNWQSMLWHEFCHVVTLQLTQNKMPRWLSEGISVYEERQADPSWGEHLNPRYREMLLGEDFTPVSQLSRAFLSPKTGEHLQFAYYESSLLVQFLVERFGQQKLERILRDLADGAEINDALAKNTIEMSKLEEQFDQFGKEIARNMAPGLDWERPQGTRGANPPLPLKPLSRPPMPEFKENAQELGSSTGTKTNYWALQRQIGGLLEQKKWPEAKALLETLLSLYPQDTGPENAYAQLAQVHHLMGETNREISVLKELAQRDDEALDAYARLMELATSAADWQTVLINGDRYLAVDPLARVPYRFIAPAAESAGQADTAIAAYEDLLLLDPPNPADVHFRLAKLLHTKRDPSARRHVLQALEEAPRFREALRLLKEMNDERVTEAKPKSENRNPNEALAFERTAERGGKD